MVVMGALADFFRGSSCLRTSLSRQKDRRRRAVL
jgi:hypothetical protein